MKTPHSTYSTMKPNRFSKKPGTFRQLTMSIKNVCKINPRTPRSILCFFFAILCADLSAETVDKEPSITGNWYQVEVLIFRHNTAFESTQEKWPQKIDRSFPANLSILNSGENSTPGAAFTILAPANYSFSNHLAELERRKNIKPLYHVAWRQPRIDKTMAQPLLIQAGEITEDDQFELEGTIKISIKRYIHIDTDLWLSSYQKAEKQPENDWWAFSTDEKPYLFQEDLISPEQSTPLDAPIVSHFPAPEILEKRPYLTKYIARMQQTRRMNRDELHYLDHPLFGLLVKTTRYEMPQEIPTADENVAAPHAPQ